MSVNGLFDFSLNLIGRSLKAMLCTGVGVTLARNDSEIFWDVWAYFIEITLFTVLSVMPIPVSQK